MLESKDVQHVMASISFDFNQVLIANKNENYLIEKSYNRHDGVEYDIKSLYYLKNKVIRKAVVCS